MHLFDVCFAMNTLVTLVYWTALHSDYIKQPHIVADPNRLYLSILAHSLPFLSHTANYLITKHIVLDPWAVVYNGPLLMLVYGLYNGIGCYYAQVKIYWFLDWEKPIAYYSTVVLYVALSLIHFVCGTISVNYRQQRPKQN